MHRNLPLCLFAVAVNLLPGCMHRGTATARAPVGASAAPPGPRFRDVAKEAGVVYRWTAPEKRPLNILQTIGNGAAFLDWNSDGNLDLLLVGPRPALFQGDGRGRFTDATAPAGLDRVRGHLLGCATGDFDNDDDTDVYLSAYRGGLLLRSDGASGFTDVTRAVGLGAQPWGSACAFGDVDGDGRLDLYVGNYVVFGPETKPQLCDFSGVLGSCGPRFYRPERGVLYRNEGGRFREVTQAWGAGRVSGKALGAAFADFDQSGRLSLAIANDEVPGDLLLNQGGRFRNIGPDSGTAFDNDGNVHGGMGLDWGDFDNDGRLDLAVATFTFEPKNVYRNEGGHQFTDVSTPLGITEHTTRYIAFGMKWLDADNDGWLDLALANGNVQDNIAQIDRTLSYRQPTQLFRNLQGTAFENWSDRAGADLRRPIVGRGLAVGDYDNDGRLDMIVVDSEGEPRLLRNETTPAGHWLSCRLVGTKSNRDGLGALITAEAGGRRLLRHCATDGSYFSASDRRVHFGLGSAARATVTVRWPSGRTDIHRDLAVDRVVTLRERERE